MGIFDEWPLDYFCLILMGHIPWVVSHSVEKDRDTKREEGHENGKVHEHNV